MVNIGDRAIAIKNTDIENKKLYYYGYGTYIGETPCPFLFNHPNPTIELENNKGKVYGCECWWSTNLDKVEESWPKEEFEYIEVPLDRGDDNE